NCNSLDKSPCRAQTGPCRARTGPCRAQTGPCRARTGPCRAQTGPCRARTGPCRAQTGPLRVKPLLSGIDPAEPVYLYKFSEAPQLHRSSQKPQNCGGPYLTAYSSPKSLNTSISSTTTTILKQV
uniref:Uncharacterized protein n=1 Tax=Pygocentrus nattereri TaxID=42514 RepID=A0A3B4DJU1_PYGNA